MCTDVDFIIIDVDCVQEWTLYRFPLTENHWRLSLQLDHKHTAWQADWHQVVFSDESLFNLWDHDGSVRVRRYAGQCCLPELAMERHSCRTSGDIVWGRFRVMHFPICYELRVISLAIGTSVKCYSSNLFPSFKEYLELCFIRIMQAHILQRLFETSVRPNICNFFLGLFICRVCYLLGKCAILLIVVSLVIRAL